MNRRWLRFALPASSVVVAALEVSAFAVSCWSNHQYASEGIWLVGEYAEPARSSILVLAVLSTLAAGGYWRLPRGAPSARGFVASLAVFTLATLSCVELGSGVYFNQITGEFYIAAVVFTRERLQFATTQDGVCVDADPSGRYTWRLNRFTVHPHLLPLPFEAEALRAVLSRKAPAACPR